MDNGCCYFHSWRAALYLSLCSSSSSSSSRGQELSHRGGCYRNNKQLWLGNLYLWMCAPLCQRVAAENLGGPRMCCELGMFGWNGHMLIWIRGSAMTEEDYAVLREGEEGRRRRRDEMGCWDVKKKIEWRALWCSYKAIKTVFIRHLMRRWYSGWWYCWSSSLYLT